MCEVCNAAEGGKSEVTAEEEFRFRVFVVAGGRTSSGGVGSGTVIGDFIGPASGPLLFLRIEWPGTDYQTVKLLLACSRRKDQRALHGG